MIFSRSYERSRLCCNATSVWRQSVVCNVCIVAKRCILEQRLLSTAHKKSYVTNRFVPKLTTLTFAQRLIQVMSTIASHSSLNISETVKRWPVTDDVTCPWKFKLVTQIRLERNISKTAADLRRSRRISPPWFRNRIRVTVRVRDVRDRIGLGWNSPGAPRSYCINAKHLGLSLSFRLEVSNLFDRDFSKKIHLTICKTYS